MARIDLGECRYELSYYSPSTRTEYDLEDERFSLEDARQLRDWQWSYTLSGRALSGVTVNGREAKPAAHVTSQGFPYLDALLAAWNADIRAGKPGSLYACDSIGYRWKAKAYVMCGSFTALHPMGSAELDLTVILCDGVWRHKKQLIIDTADAPQSDTVIADYPHDDTWDMLTPPKPDTVTTGVMSASPVNITFYGPATNPSIRIGSNTYQVDVALSDGQYCEVNQIDHTVTVVNSTGSRSSVFDKAHRGTGKGSGEYIFQPLPAGVLTVSKSASLCVVLTLIDERVMPPFTSVPPPMIRKKIFLKG